MILLLTPRATSVSTSISRELSERSTGPRARPMTLDAIEMVGAIIALGIMGAPFGFMAFLGVVSLVGVIVSHVIVLFDFIEEAREKGEGLEEALLDAGILRLRPVLITVGATVFALVPLALHGGPLWEPLCYAQIGGLAVATVITLLLVPVFNSIAVLDLNIVKWERGSTSGGIGGLPLVSGRQWV